MPQFTLHFCKKEFHFLLIDFGKKNLRTRQEQIQACCPIEHKRKVFRLAVLKIIRVQNIRTEPDCHLYCTACRLVLQTNFNTAL